MQRVPQNKEYESFIERIVKKGDKALAEFEAYLQTQINENLEQLTKIIDYFVFTSELPTLNQAQKSAIIQVFQRICYAVHDNGQLDEYLPKMVDCIIKFFNDPSDKIRFCAISSIYNVFKFLDDDCLAVFTKTFKELPCIITDPSAEVKQAAAHLNHTMKILLNNAVLSHHTFDYEHFINILTENFLLANPIIKEFLIDWINTIDEIKEFEITKYLPLFLKKLFLFLVDENKNVRIKAEECLNGFIEAFKLSFTCSKEQITKRYKLEETQMILVLLIKTIEESIVFESFSNIEIHVFTWLDSFCCFLIEEINQGLEPFLSRIIVKIFQPLFEVMIQAFSIEPDNIQAKILNIHDNLIKAYSFLYSHSPEIEKACVNFEKALSECTSPIKTEVIIKWINRMAENNTEAIFSKIGIFIEFLVDKICESSAKNLASLLELLEGSIFTLNYFSELIHQLLLKLQSARTPNEPAILNQIVNLSNSDHNFMLLCSEVIDLPLQRYAKFRVRMAETLIGFLITESSLRDFRQNIKKRKIQPEIFSNLALAMVESKAAYVILCFLIRDYETATHIFTSTSDATIDYPFMHSLFRMCNLLMHPALHQIFVDMGCQNQVAAQARRAYLSLLMYLPVNKATSVLVQKAKQLGTDQDGFGFVYLKDRRKEERSQAYEVYCSRYRAEECGVETIQK